MGKVFFSFIFVLLMAGSVCLADKIDKEQVRQKVQVFLRDAGFGDELDKGVKVSVDEQGVFCITDEGNFTMQYMVLGPEQGGSAKIEIAPDVKIADSVDKAVIATHGWFDKAVDDWPADIAHAINERVDPNEWVCGYFDWKSGAIVANPVDSAKYAIDIGGPRLAEAFLKMAGGGCKFSHIHLIGHSAGSWAIHSAAKIIAERTGAQIHLTFLDAYVPPWKKEEEMGDFGDQVKGWCEHYYTKDITLKCTQENLSSSWNVDLTKIDRAIKKHEFPYEWYYATVTGQYRKKDGGIKKKVISKMGGVEYGFGRSREAGDENWQKSLELKKGHKAVELKKPKQKSWFDFLSRN